MKFANAALIVASLLLSASFGYAKARPMPKPKPPVHKCAKGQHWDKGMKMCMPN